MTEKHAPKANKTARSPWRLTVGILSSVLLLWALLPLVCNGIFGVGVAVPAVVGAGGLWWGFWAKMPVGKRKGWRKVLQITLAVCLCIGVAASILFSGLMIGAASRRTKGDSTVIVLGSRIYYDRPSRMLEDRLKAALAYLQENPQANCVVSGGLGKGETYTEAYVMHKYLTEHGIAPERIAMEDRSTDTHENIYYSMEIIKEKGWSTSLVIATQVFHQYRAAALAKQAGAARVAAAPCFSPPHLMLNYWVRECAAICRLCLFNY